mgnify:CR=1 FL=1
MFYVGKPPAHAQRLTETDLPRRCGSASSTVRPGARLGDIGHAIQQLRRGEAATRSCANTAATASDASIHEDPQVLHYGQPAPASSSQAGMTFTIEPMVNAGKRDVDAAARTAGPSITQRPLARPRSGSTRSLVTETGLRSTDARRRPSAPRRPDHIGRACEEIERSAGARIACCRGLSLKTLPSRQRRNRSRCDRRIRKASRRRRCEPRQQRFSADDDWSGRWFAIARAWSTRSCAVPGD